MQRSALIFATAASLVFAAAAVAQVPRGLERSGAAGEASSDTQSVSVLSARHYQDGVEALQAKNFAVAEGIFDEFLRINPTHPDGNLMMGTTEMSLNKWNEAKKYLEIAVKKAPKNPDPKSRLAVTLVKLGDLEGALKLRADLVKMDKDCKGTCRSAQYIVGGIAMIDGAMPPKQP